MEAFPEALLDDVLEVDDPQNARTTGVGVAVGARAPGGRDHPRCAALAGDLLDGTVTAGS